MESANFLPERAISVADFTGRKKEITELIDWFNDPEDSKRCLVYGDGGIGKTTLILEFMHRVLEGSIEVEWKPSVITFYTAKKDSLGNTWFRITHEQQSRRCRCRFTYSTTIRSQT